MTDQQTRQEAERLSDDRYIAVPSHPWATDPLYYVRDMECGGERVDVYTTEEQAVKRAAWLNARDRDRRTA